MSHEYPCQAHGHMLVQARDEEGRLTALREAYQNRGAKTSYFCPNDACGVEVFPVSGAVDYAGNLYRRGHFRAVADETNPRRNPRESGSITDLVKESLALQLEESEDFDRVDTNVPYHHRIKKDDGWWRGDRATLDVVARRDGEDSLDTVLHVLDMNNPRPLKEIYKGIKELAGEPSPGRKQRYVDHEGEWDPLGKKIYQNIVVIPRQGILDSEDGQSIVTPSVYNFVGYLGGGQVPFFDASSMTLRVATLGTPEELEDTHEKDSRRKFRMSVQDMPYFTLVGEDRGLVKRELKNFPGRNSINLPNWKIAVPHHVLVDAEGKPLPKSTSKRQTAFDF